MVMLYLLKVLATKNHALPRLQRLPWTLLIFLWWKHVEALDVNLPLTLSDTLPLAMDKATHLLTLCESHCAPRRGYLCLILYIINLLGLLNLLLGMSRPLTMIPRDEALGGLPVKRFNLGGGTRNGKGTDKYFPPWILARLHGHKHGSGPRILSPDSALISLALPRTHDMYRRALRIYLQRALCLCILARLRGPERGAGPLILNPDSPRMYLVLHRQRVMFLRVLPISLLRAHPLICPRIPLTSFIWRL